MNKYHLGSVSHAEWHCTFENHLRDLETDTLLTPSHLPMSMSVFLDNLTFISCQHGLKEEK